MDQEGVESDLEKVFEESIQCEKLFIKLKKQAEIKYYFDFNYNLNSIVFTGQILNTLEIKYLSKYSVSYPALKDGACSQQGLRIYLSRSLSIQVQEHQLSEH
jgi:hypothetical protein